MIAPRKPFVLIRHGQTDANRDGIIAGSSEARLTETGRAAARALASWSWPERMTLFTSPQHRARETAALAFPDHPQFILAGLRERDWGRFEGRPVHQLPPRQDTPEGGEPWPDMLARVAAALGAGLDHSGPALAVLVAHSGVVRAVRQLTGGTAHGPSPANTAPFLFAPEGNGWRETQLDKNHALLIA